MSSRYSGAEIIDDGAANPLFLVLVIDVLLPIAAWEKRVREERTVVALAWTVSAHTPQARKCHHRVFPDDGREETRALAKDWALEEVAWVDRLLDLRSQSASPSLTRVNQAIRVKVRSVCSESRARTSWSAARPRLSSGYPSSSMPTGVGVLVCERR